MLYLKCKGQVMSVDVDERIADQYINANTVHFEFCERWNGMTITAQFTQTHKNEETGVEESKTYNKLIDEVTNTVILPNEIVAGKVEISAFGVHPTTGVRITSVPVKKTVDKSGFVGDGELSIPPTPDLYAQLLEKVNKTAIPHIGANGNWWFDDWDSGVAATAEVDAARQAAVNEINRAAANQMVEMDNKFANTMRDIPETYTELDADVKSLKDTKADAIRDTSAKAVSHELHVQDGPMSVTLHGKTTETGSGEKSPENPYTIKGVDKAEIQAGNKNLYGGMYMAEDIAEKVPSAVIDTDTKTIKYTAGAISGVRIFDRFKPNTQYTIIITSSELANANRPNLAVYYTDTSTPLVLTFAENAGTKRQLVYKTLAGKSVKYLVGYNNSGTQYLLYEECGIFEGVLTADDFEAFNANVIDLPLLPDGDPLMEGDTVENDVASGCDKSVTVAGTHSNSHLTPLTNTVRVGYRNVALNTALAAVYYSDKFAPSTDWAGDYEHFYLAADGQAFIWIEKKKLASVDYDGVNAYFAANPLKVYYRSTEYTPEKDLRVCRVTRRKKLEPLAGKVFNRLAGVETSNLTYVWIPKFADADFYGSWEKHELKATMLNLTYASTVPDDSARIFTVSTTGSADGMFIGMPYGTTPDEAAALLADCVIEYTLKYPAVYMSDHHDLRKPYGIMPATVTGSGETAVEYPHDTKHYIDSQIAAAVALALNG